MKVLRVFSLILVLTMLLTTSGCMNFGQIPAKINEITEADRLGPSWPVTMQIPLFRDFTVTLEDLGGVEGTLKVQPGDDVDGVWEVDVEVDQVDANINIDQSSAAEVGLFISKPDEFEEFDVTGFGISFAISIDVDGIGADAHIELSGETSLLDEHDNLMEIDGEDAKTPFVHTLGLGANEVLLSLGDFGEHFFDAEKLEFYLDSVKLVDASLDPGDLPVTVELELSVAHILINFTSISFEVPAEEAEISVPEEFGEMIESASLQMSIVNTMPFGPDITISFYDMDPEDPSEPQPVTVGISFEGDSSDTQNVEVAMSEALLEMLSENDKVWVKIEIGIDKEDVDRELGADDQMVISAKLVLVARVNS